MILGPVQFGSIVLNGFSKFGLAMNFVLKFANELLSYILQGHNSPLAKIFTSSNVEIFFALAHHF